MTTAQIGSISSGTLRIEDLLPTFTDELESLAGETHNLVEEANKLMAQDGWENTKRPTIGLKGAWTLDDLLTDIQDALSDYAPTLCYFGTLEGDGADFGFWPDFGSITTERHFSKHVDEKDCEYLEESGVWVFVNDHGNLTVYADANGEPGDELWSVV